MFQPISVVLTKLQGQVQFMGIGLGARNHTLAICCQGLIYLVHYVFNDWFLAPEQKKQNETMMFTSEFPI